MGKIDTKSIKKLVNIEKYLLRSENRQELLRRISKEAVSLLGVDIASIYSLSLDDDMMLIRESGYGLDESKIKNREVPLSFSKTAQEAFKTKKPVVVFDVRKEGKIPKEFVKKYDLRSSFTLPLIGLKGEVMGFLFLDVTGKTKRFSSEDKVLAECFANLAAISIEQTRLKEGLKKKIGILSAYSDITSSAVHPLNIKDVMERVLIKSIEVLGMDRGTIRIVENGELVVKSHIGVPKSYLKKYASVKIGQLLCGKVAKTGEPIIIEDAYKDKRTTKKIIEKLEYSSYISIPLLAENRVIGVLSVASNKKRRFEKEEIDFFDNTGRELGVLIGNAMLFERMDFTNKKVQALLELNQSIVSILDLSILYKKVLNELPSIIPCSAAAIMLVDEREKELNLVASFSPKKRQFETLKLKLGQGITGRVAKTGKPAIIPDVRKDKRYIGKIKEIRSEIAVPLSVKGRIAGVLNVESDKLNIYSKEDMDILTAFGNQIAIAIENARLYQESKERTAHLELINRVIKEIDKTQDINALSQRLCDVIQGHFYYAHTLLYLLDKEGKNLVLKGYSGLPYKIKEFRQSVEKGLLGLCVTNRKSILENNTEKNKMFVSKLPREEAVLSEMDIPLISGNKVFGVLSLQSAPKDAFSEWDRVAMETISEHFASSLNNAKLHSDLTHRLSELSSVYEIGVGLSISEDLDGFLEKMYGRTSSMTGAKTFCVALHNEGDSSVRFEIEYCEGIRIPKKSLELSDIDGYTRWILKNNNPILRRDLKKDVDRYPMEPTNYGLKMQSYLGVPIRFKDKVIGVLSFQSPKPNLFDESTTSLFTAFANQLGVVIANKRLFTEMDIVLKKLEKSYNVTLRSLVSALDFRERETQYHSIRVALYAVELAKRLNVPERELKYVYWGGILHDIGKIGVPDKILLKPAKLTEEEWKVMRKHPEVGYVIVKDINFLKEANDIVLYHHEWWNGSGYPCGKKEHDIPFYARIFSVADAFDSMTSDRPYKKAISFEDADLEIQNGLGTQFDPEVVSVYFSVPSKLWERIKRTKPFRVDFPLPHLDKIHIQD